jgi:Fe-S cluster assembly protein SufD
VLTGAPDAAELEAWSVERGEPSWLLARRRRALNDAQSLPVPTMTTEGWRRTDLTEMDLPALRARVASGGGAAPVDGDFGELSAQLRIVDGVADEPTLQPELAAKGVILLPLADAVERHPELVQRYLGRAVAGNESVFVAMADALWTNGTFVYVPRGVAVEHPMLSTVVMASGEPHYGRTLVVLDQGAELTFIDNNRSANGPSGSTAGEAFASHIVEVFTEPEARLRYVNVQAWNTATWSFTQVRGVQDRSSRIDWLGVAVGGRVHRFDLDATLEGRGAETQIDGLLFGDSNQHFDVQTLQWHVGDDTFSDCEFKAALAERSSSTFVGTIRVNKTSLRTGSNVESRNLLLSKQSRAEADPRLEILNSDVVRCGHGATVGPLDPEIIYYLQTRGIAREEAQKIVVEAFFDSVLDKIPVEAIRHDVWRTLQRKLGRDVHADHVPVDIMDEAA